METTTDLTLFDLNETEIVKKLAVTKEELLSLVKQSKHYTITGIDDKQGLSQVHEHRILLRDKRIEIEKGAKALRDNATRFSRTVSAREKEFISIISPEEERLKSKELWVEGEKEKIKVEEERKRAEALQAKIDALHAVGASHDLVELQVIPDEVFAELLEQHTIAYNHKKAKEEEERLFKEAEVQKEKDRIAEEARIYKRTMDRASQLLAAGVYFDKTKDAYVSLPDGVIIGVEGLKTMTDEAFEAITKEVIKLTFARRKKEAEDLAEFNRQKTIQEGEAEKLRLQQEHFIKEKAAFEATRKAQEDEKRRVEELEAAKKKAAEEALKLAEYEAKEIAFQARLEKERKDQEMAEAPDKVKLANLGLAIENLLAIPIVLSTKTSKERYQAACNLITEVIDKYLMSPKK